VWKEVGTVVTALAEKAPQWQDKLSHGLLNDMLIAPSGRSLGATVVTRNGEDFRLIRQFRAFALEII
jgi:predicted nucleic acid-binding protein